MGAKLLGEAAHSEYVIALFVGMLAVVIFRRRSTPKAVEIVLWAGLIWVCILAITGIHEPHARALTSAVTWGISQTVGTLAGLFGQGVKQWISESRFAIADWVVLLFGADLMLLALISTNRRTEGQLPQAWLRDWMELPRPGRAQSAPAPVSAVDQINQRINVWAPIAAAAALTWMTLLLIWAGDVVVPGTARKLKRAAVTADGARRRVTATNWQGLLGRVATEPRHLTEVVDIDIFTRRAVAMKGQAADWLTDVGSMPQIDWMNGLGVLPPYTDGGIEEHVAERDHRDRLAS